MTNEEAKNIMLKIMLDLLFAEDIEDVLDVIAKHLELSEQDIEEVNNRFNGEVRDAFINAPGFSSSKLAKSLAKAEQEKRRKRNRAVAEREAKNIMLRIMLDLLFAESIEGVLSVIAVHINLNEQDCQEVMNRFNGVMRDAFGNHHPEFPASALARFFAEEKKENREKDE